MALSPKTNNRKTKALLREAETTKKGLVMFCGRTNSRTW